MSELPPIPEREFGEAWHTYLTELHACVEDQQKEIEGLKTTEEEEEELSNQLVQAITTVANGDTTSTFTNFSSLDGEIELSEIDIQAEGQVLCLANFQVLSSALGQIMEIKLYHQDAVVQSVQFAAQNTQNNPNNHWTLSHLAQGSGVFKATITGISAGNLLYNLAGCNLTVFEIKE